MYDVEQTVPGYIGHDALISHYVDEEDFQEPWVGDSDIVLSINSHFKHRSKERYDGKLIYPNYKMYERFRGEFNCRYYGDINPGYGPCRGKISFQKQIEELKNSRVYLALGSKPGPITYNLIEAWMAGTPVVTFGDKLGNHPKPVWNKLYKVPELMENGREGFYSDDEEELKKYIRLLLEDYDLAKQISVNGRKKALSLFSKQVVKEAWKKFFEEKGLM
jgi:hypothetical protein